MKTYTQLIYKLCGKWPLRQPPMTPTSWYLLPSEMWNSLLFPGEMILLFLVSRKHRMSLLRSNYKKTVVSILGILSLCQSFSLLELEESSCHITRHLCGRAIWYRTQNSWQPMEWVWMQISPRQAFKWEHSLSQQLQLQLQPFEKSWNRDTHLSCTQIPDQQTLWVLNVCYFKS